MLFYKAAEEAAMDWPNELLELEDVLAERQSACVAPLSFDETLGLLLDHLGQHVRVTVADRGSLLDSAFFGGTLERGDEILRGIAGDAEAVCFRVDTGGGTATFTLTSRGFDSAMVQDRELVVWASGVEFTISLP